MQFFLKKTFNNWQLELPSPWFLQLIFVVFFVVSGLVFLQTKFPIFNDEALYSEMVLRLTQGYGLSTPLFRDFMPLVEKYAYWYPPLYFFILAPLFVMFGASVEVMRLFSLICGVAVLALMYKFARKTLVFSYSTVILLMMLVFDPYLQEGSVVGRMEILCLMWSLLALISHLNWIRTGLLKWNFFTGMFTTLGLLTHPIAVVVALPLGMNLLLNPSRSFKPKLTSVFCFIAPVFFGLFLWMVSFWSNFDIFLLQNQLQMHRKAYNIYYIIDSLRFKPLNCVILSVYICSNTWFLIRGFFKKIYLNSCGQFLLLLAFSSLFFPIFLKEIWYVVYLSLFGIYFLVINIEWFWQRRIYWPIIFFLIVIIINSIIYFEKSEQIIQIPESYNQFSQRLADQLPIGAKVLLSSFPDPYFYFLKLRPDLQLRETPNSPLSEPIDVSVYDTVLRDVDYAIVSYFSNQHLSQYLQKNLESIIYESQEKGKYKVLILKLKPVKERLPLEVAPHLQWQYPKLGSWKN